MDIVIQNKGIIRIDVLASHTFRVRYSQCESFTEGALNRYGILKKEINTYTSYETEEDEDRCWIVTDKAILSIHKTTGKMALSNSAGKILLENTDSPRSKEGFDFRLKLDQSEKIYGLGDVTRDCIEKRGFRTRMWVSNVASYIPISFLMSSQGWGLFLNTTWKHYIDVGCKKEEELRCWSNGGELDYYLFAGDSYAEILDYYTDIVGKPAMMPLWAFGLTFVCNQQVNAREMVEDGLNFRREGIPCDLLGLEPGWMETYYDTTVDKKWDPNRFYLPYWSPQGDHTFLSALKRIGFKTSLWLCTDYDFSYYEEQQLETKAKNNADDIQGNYNEEDDFEKDEHLGHEPLKMDKITKEDEPWFEHLKKFVDQGVVAFKLDAAYQVNEHPDRLYGNGMTDEEMHNLYPVLYNKQMSLGYGEYTGERPMIYTAGGYAGIAQYSASWAGDTGGGLKPLISMLNHGMSGHSNTSCDMDIFSTEGIHFGFLQPWSQLSNWAYWKQPWLLEPHKKQIFKEYTILRYRLIPYLYSAAHVANRTGMPIMRAMDLAYPEYEESHACFSQYMLGDSLLVAVFTNEVYLPEGKWIDFWTGECYEGGRKIVYSIPENKGGALFVKEDAVIPMWEPMQYVGEKPIETIELHVYGGEKGSCTLYEDDGITFRYMEGEIAITDISYTREEDCYQFKIDTTGSYEGMPTNRKYKVILHGQEEGSKVMVNGAMQ